MKKVIIIILCAFSALFIIGYLNNTRYFSIDYMNLYREEIQSIYKHHSITKTEESIDGQEAVPYNQVKFTNYIIKYSDSFQNQNEHIYTNTTSFYGQLENQISNQIENDMKNSYLNDETNELSIEFHNAKYDFSCDVYKENEQDKYIKDITEFKEIYGNINLNNIQYNDLFKDNLCYLKINCDKSTSEKLLSVIKNINACMCINNQKTFYLHGKKLPVNTSFNQFKEYILKNID